MLELSERFIEFCEMNMNFLLLLLVTVLVLFQSSTCLERYLLHIANQAKMNSQQRNLTLQQLHSMLLKQNETIARMELVISNQNTKLTEMETTLTNGYRETTSNQAASQNLIIANLETIVAKQSIKMLELENYISKQSNRMLDHYFSITIGNQRKVLEHCDSKLDSMKRSSSDSHTGSIVITRWGRRGCHGGSEIIYSGMVCGSDLSRTNSGMDFLCMPQDSTMEIQNETQVLPRSTISAAFFQDNTTTNNQPTCAVCRYLRYSTLVTIPGRSECYSGWRKAYDGFMVSGYWENGSATQYTCFDANVEFDSKNRTTSSDLYMTYHSVNCLSMPCPPYHDSKLLPCVVCLK